MTIPARNNPPLGGGDLARDIAAATALLVSLALPWTLGLSDSFAATRLDVLLVTLLTAFGAGLTFLVRSGALGALSIRAALLIRLGFAAPYGLLVLVYALLDMFGLVPTLGAAVGVGLAGVALIAQPRRSELAGEVSAAPLAARIAIVGTWLALGSIIVLTLAGAIGSVVGVRSPAAGFLTVHAVISVIVQGAAAALLFIGVLRRSPSARMIAWVVALAGTPLVLLSVPLGGMLTVGAHGAHLLPWLLIAAGALCSPGIDLLMPAQPPLQLWFRTARDALVVAAIAGGLLTIAGVVRGVTLGANAALVVVITVCLLAAGGAALIARARLVADPANSRVAVLGLASTAVGLGFVAVVLTIVVRATSRIAGAADVLAPILPAVAVVAPAALAIVALTAPAAVRAYVSDTPLTASGAAGGALSPAADPATPAEQLSVLAGDPANWVALAGNPASYPELLDYLGQHGDAAVQQVLAARRLS